MSVGFIVGIYIAPVARAPMRSVDQVLAIAGCGLQGDRYTTGNGSYNKDAVGKRQVTLINARFFQGTGFQYHESRRNIIVRDMELMYLIGREFDIGAARMRGVKYCDPCLIPSTLAGKSIRFDDVFHDHGGLVAEILTSGFIHKNDPVVPPQKNY